jgi:hypothetical protein
MSWVSAESSPAPAASSPAGRLSQPWSSRALIWHLPLSPGTTLKEAAGFVPKSGYLRTFRDARLKLRLTTMIPDIAPPRAASRHTVAVIVGATDDGAGATGDGRAPRARRRTAPAGPAPAATAMPMAATPAPAGE